MSESNDDFLTIKAPEHFWEPVPVSFFDSTEVDKDFWSDVPVSFVDSTEVDKDFWKPVQKQVIGKVSESIVENIKLPEMVLSEVKKDFLKTKLKHLFEKGHHYQVRGNGFCFINAIFSILIKKYPKVGDYDYNSFLILFQMILSNHGIVDESPDDLDAVLASRVTREVLAILGIHNASFAIFSLYDFTISFNVEHSEEEYPIYQKDLFCILHNEGHFSGIYYGESNTEELFDMLTFDMAQ